MKKCIWTLNINDYAPEICELTYPLLRHYAKKINAEFRILSQRQFSDWPVVYEKFQIHELGKEFDWNIYIDSDALVHPDMFDPTNHVNKDTVLHNGADMAGNRWRYDHYFWRDGRHIGSCNWFTVGSNWCLDLWRPLDCSYEEAVQNVFPIVNEVNSGVIPSGHLIDDYTCSCNIARFGLKFTTVSSLLEKINDRGNYLWHAYTIPPAEKLVQMVDILRVWKLEKVIPLSLPIPDSAIKLLPTGKVI